MWRNYRGRQVLSAEGRAYKANVGWLAKAAGAKVVDLVPGAAADPLRRHLPPLALLEAVVATVIAMKSAVTPTTSRT
jgi:hypothetical protein